MKETVLIKIGGRAAEKENALLALAGEMKTLSSEYDFILVHGGGAVVSAIQKQYGIEPLFGDGKRITAPREMDIVDMGLAGKMNTYLVRLFLKAGLNPVGLSGCDGKLFRGVGYGPYEGRENRSGEVASCDTSLIDILLPRGYLPVVCSVSFDESGLGININADDAALGLAEALRVSRLLFISDIPGVLRGDRLLSTLNNEEIGQLIEDGTISGGMIPKVRSSLEALRKGVEKILITDYSETGDLNKLISGVKGTLITL